MNRVHLYYHAGNGGYFALWIALLGSDYRCGFNNFPIGKFDLDYVFKCHWNKTSLESWAHHEIENDDQNTLASLYPNQIFLTCNPNRHQWSNPHGKRIIIYTDLLTQTMLSIEKQTSVSIFCNNYTNLHDTAKEMAHLMPSIVWNNKIISSAHHTLMQINEAEYAIDLKEIIKTNGEILLSALGAESNSACVDFTKKYISMHSAEMQERLLQ